MRLVIKIHILIFLSFNVFSQSLILRIKDANKSCEIPNDIYSVKEVKYINVVSGIEPFDMIIRIDENEVKFKIIESKFIDYSQNNVVRIVKENGAQEIIDSTVTYYNSSFHKVSESIYDTNGEHLIINHYDDLGRVFKIEEINGKDEKIKRSMSCKYYDNTEIIKSIDSHLGFSTIVNSTKENSTITYTYKSTLPNYIKTKLNEKDELKGMPEMKSTLMIDSVLNEHFYFYTDSRENESTKFNSYFMYDSLGNLRIKKKIKNDRVIEHVEFTYNFELLQIETDFVLDDIKHFSYDEFGRLISMKGKIATTTYEYDKNDTVLRVIEIPKYGNTSIVDRIVKYK